MLHSVMTTKCKWMRSQLSLGDDRFKTGAKLKNCKCVGRPPRNPPISPAKIQAIYAVPQPQKRNESL